MAVFVVKRAGLPREPAHRVDELVSGTEHLREEPFQVGPASAR
jgi:hypothetical protein